MAVKVGGLEGSACTMDVCVNRGREPYTPRDVCVGVESLTHRGMYVLG